MNEYQEALKVIMDDTCHISELNEPIQTIKKLVDKETPVKPEYISLLTNPPQNRTRCGNCKGAHLEKVFKFCPYCGQLVEWADEDE